MKKLEVVFAGWGERWPLGTLADNGAALLFEYSPEALRRRIAFSPLCLALRAAAHGGFPAHQQRLPGLVADALPDVWGMPLMDRLLRKQGWAPSRLSPLERLAFIGERAMGALCFTPAPSGERAGLVDGLDPLAALAALADTSAVAPADIDLLELARAAHTVGLGKEAPLLRQLVWLNGSATGARPKVLLPDGDAPWLIKFPAPGEHKEVCAIEHVYAELARACGLDMPATHHFDLDRRLAALGCERYDRADGMRVPVQSLAGVLHADFRQQSVDYAMLLRATRLMTRDESAVRKAFQRCVFNVVFNQRDDHARHFGYRMNRQWQWELAPCHDLSFSQGADGAHRMPVMGESRAPAAADLLRLAADAALPPRWAADVIGHMAEQGGMFAALARTAPIRAATVKAISRAIEANRLRMCL